MRLVVLVLTVLGAVACTSVKDTAEPPSELVDFDRAADLDELWSAGTGGGTDKWIGLMPARDGQTVFAAGLNGEVAAYAVDGGGRQWRRRVDGRVTAGLGAGGTSVYAGTQEGDVVALSARDGSVRWRTGLDAELLAPPAANANHAVARTVDGRIVSIDAATGEVQWTFATDVPSLSLRGNGAPLLVSDAVVAGLDNGRVLALSAGNGQAIWQRAIAEPSGRSLVERLVDIDGAIDVGRGVIYAAAYQGSVAQISPRQGEILWEREMSSFSGLQVDGRRVYVTTAESHVVALDPGSGATLWRQQKMAHRRLSAPVPIAGTPYLVVGDLEGYVHILTRADGRIVARDDAGGGSVLAKPLALGEGRFAVQTQGGDLAVYGVGPLD